MYIYLHKENIVGLKPYLKVWSCDFQFKKMT